MTWREYVLLCKAHDQERNEQFEYARLIAYCAIKPYLKEGTLIHDFMPLGSDEHDEISEDSIEKQNELVKQMAETYAKERNLQQPWQTQV